MRVFMKNTANSTKKYEDKRKIKPISFNMELEGDIYDVSGSINLSVWVKHILSSLSMVEINLLKKAKNGKADSETFNVIPVSLIERALDQGWFDLDEYLKAKGLKVVGITEDCKKHTGADTQNYDEFCQLSGYDDI